MTFITGVQVRAMSLKVEKCCPHTCNPLGYLNPKAALLPSQLTRAICLGNPILSHLSPPPRVRIQALLLPSAHTDDSRGKLTAARASLTLPPPAPYSLHPSLNLHHPPKQQCWQIPCGKAETQERNRVCPFDTSTEFAYYF